MVAWHVVVIYDEKEVVFDDYIVASGVKEVEVEAMEFIYNDGLINPYLHSVYQKLSFNIEQV